MARSEKLGGRSSPPNLAVFRGRGLSIGYRAGGPGALTDGWPSRINCDTVTIR